MTVLPVICASQEDFRRAILQPGPPESFALQTVQEFIKPQVTSWIFIHMHVDMKITGSYTPFLFLLILHIIVKFYSVYWVVKWQRQTKLAQDENQLLENMLRTLLQELVVCLYFFILIQIAICIIAVDFVYPHFMYDCPSTDKLHWSQWKSISLLKWFSLFSTLCLAFKIDTPPTQPPTSPSFVTPIYLYSTSSSLFHVHHLM